MADIQRSVNKVLTKNHHSFNVNFYKIDLGRFYRKRNLIIVVRQKGRERERKLVACITLIK